MAAAGSVLDIRKKISDIKDDKKLRKTARPRTKTRHSDILVFGGRGSTLWSV